MNFTFWDQEEPTLYIYTYMYVLVKLPTAYRIKKAVSSIELLQGAIIFFGGSHIYISKLVKVSKIATPLFQQQNFYDPPLPTTNTPYPWTA